MKALSLVSPKRCSHAPQRRQICRSSTCINAARGTLVSVRNRPSSERLRHSEWPSFACPRKDEHHLAAFSSTCTMKLSTVLCGRQRQRWQNCVTHLFWNEAYALQVFHRTYCFPTRRPVPRPANSYSWAPVWASWVSYSRNAAGRLAAKHEVGVSSLGSGSAHFIAVSSHRRCVQGTNHPPIHQHPALLCTSR